MQVIGTGRLPGSDWRRDILIRSTLRKENGHLPEKRVQQGTGGNEVNWHKADAKVVPTAKENGQGGVWIM